MMCHVINRVEKWMEDVNDALGTPALKWHLGRPDKGYISAIEFSSELLEKSGINSSLELYEYLYKVSGISVGEIIPSSLSKQTGAHSIRINYGLEDNKLEAGLDLMKHAINQMKKGVTLEEARATCSNRPAEEQDMLQHMLAAFFGDGVKFKVRGIGE